MQVSFVLILLVRSVLDKNLETVSELKFLSPLNRESARPNRMLPKEVKIDVVVVTFLQVPQNKHQLSKNQHLFGPEASRLPMTA